MLEALAPSSQLVVVSKEDVLFSSSGAESFSLRVTVVAVVAVVAADAADAADAVVSVVVAWLSILLAIINRC